MIEKKTTSSQVWQLFAMLQELCSAIPQIPTIQCSAQVVLPVGQQLEPQTQPPISSHPWCPSIKMRSGDSTDPMPTPLTRHRDPGPAAPCNTSRRSSAVVTAPQHHRCTPSCPASPQVSDYMNWDTLHFIHKLYCRDLLRTEA
ncbi:unnamed protein product [Ostreobium quekettii]|uniref:Uncharacterized protein n=1 Tax=Ostreobium quekettii TaxID=121088 RepID=A0A8S1J585_9CHLO|nr:unnamed protein product [Ostreobium quekettii]